MSIEVTPRGTRGTKAPPSGVLGRAIMRVARFVHRRTGNKLAGAPLLYLTTVGARSGEPRTCTVMAFPEANDAWLIVASRSGTADHPAWYYNLAKHPDRVHDRGPRPEDHGGGTNAHRRRARRCVDADHSRAAAVRGVSGEDRPPDPGRASHRTLSVMRTFLATS